MYLCQFSTVWKRFQLSRSHDHRRSIKSVCTQSGGTWINKMGLSSFNNRFWYLRATSVTFEWIVFTFLWFHFTLFYFFYVTLYYINSRVTRIWHKICCNKYIPFLFFLSLFVEFLQWVGLGSELNFAGGSGWVGFTKLWVGLGWVSKNRPMSTSEVKCLE